MSSSHIALESYFATFSRASPGLALNPSPWALVVPGAQPTKAPLHACSGGVLHALSR